MQAALLRACAAGDAGALARLYDATSAQLFGLALRIVRRRELAEEVVQDAFLSVWRHAGRYDERRGTAMAWLATIVPSRGFRKALALWLIYLGANLCWRGIGALAH